MGSQAKRVQWVDIAKYICIMWVMLSHLESGTDLLRTFYGPFVLNGFFFVSGYVYFHKDGFKQFFIKKVRGLFVPWLFFSVFNILLSHVISFNQHTSIIEELKWNFLQIRTLNDGVWFVAALFVAYIPFYFFIKKYENSGKQKVDREILIIAALALSVISSLYEKLMDPNFFPWGTYALPWHIEYIFIAMFWMVLGYLFRTNYEQIYDAKIDTKTISVIFVVYMLITYVPFILDYTIENPILAIIYSYVTIVLGIICLIYASKRIPANRYFLYIGQNTLICFALHGKVYSVIQTLLKKFAGSFYAGVLSNTIASSIFAIIFAFVLSFILIIPIYIINRWFPFLVGRRVKKKEK